jgi:hypothetical protein
MRQPFRVKQCSTKNIIRLESRTERLSRQSKASSKAWRSRKRKAEANKNATDIFRDSVLHMVLFKPKS